MSETFPVSWYKLRDAFLVECHLWVVMYWWHPAFCQWWLSIVCPTIPLSLGTGENQLSADYGRWSKMFYSNFFRRSFVTLVQWGHIEIGWVVEIHCCGSKPLLTTSFLFVCLQCFFADDIKFHKNFLCYCCALFLKVY